ncbi:MAG: hypothetical protein KatS3mg115_0789 [Candidatus Poribacteria bacterium]|nr:MAG: hypothetical protein KatS3mg115_0789 [Candidatus Poribacteria bacterium]
MSRARCWKMLILLLSASAIPTGWAKEEGSLRAEILDAPLLGPSSAVLRRPEPSAEPSSRRAPFWLLPLWIHQRVISPQDGERCTFVPTCTQYALEALSQYGLEGLLLSADRVLRCHRGNFHEYPTVEGRKFDPLPGLVPRRWRPERSWKGGILALVPGLGQATAGHPADGLSAFQTVLFWGLGAFYYARHDRPALAVAMGSVALFFYAGNLYGGARDWGLER